MNDRVGRSAERHRRRSRAFSNASVGKDVARPEILPHHLDDPAARAAAMPRVRRSRRQEWTSRPRQRHPQRLRHRSPSSRPCPSSCTCRTSARCRPRSRATRTRRSCRRASRSSTSRRRCREPSVCPRQLPRSIGPAGTKIAGRFALVAPITSAGHGLVAAAEQDDAVDRVRARALPRPPSRAGCDRASCSAS